MLGLPVGAFSLFVGPRFLTKLPNTKKGALFIPRLLGIQKRPPELALLDKAV